jgi:hypothetical protein
MATRQTSSRSLTKIAGAILLALGLLLLFANLDEISARISTSFGSPADTIGIFPALGLAGLRALQAYVFDHSRFLSGLEQFLVSFWPLLLVGAGLILLRPAARRDSLRQRLNAASTAVSAQGER